MKNNKTNFFLLTLAAYSLIATSCQSLKTFTKRPELYNGVNSFTGQAPSFDRDKKNVFIVANTRLTELFDMIAPFYLFNTTQKANVYIVAETKSPVQVKDKLYVLPQITFNEIDSLNLHADVIVIPFLGVLDNNQNPVIVNWIKNHYSQTTRILSICDGAATAAATGLYDGKPLTCHASDYAMLTPHFKKPLWVQQVSVTRSGNLYSTAGVSNAVEGSLMVIDDLFGRETMQAVMKDINYTYPEIKQDHQSIAINGKAKMTILNKLIFRKNRSVGILLQDSINEFQLASIIDTYSRTFPATFGAYMLNDSIITTKNGLTILSTQNNQVNKLNELHLVQQGNSLIPESVELENTNTVIYSDSLLEYPIDVCIKRIAQQYGSKFATVTKMMLDYN